MVTHVPVGHLKIRATRKFEYARETFTPGAVLIIDSDSANKLIKSKHAEAIEAGPERAMLRSSCPKCHSALEIVATPKADELWTACKNPRCLHGWMRGQE